MHALCIEMCIYVYNSKTAKICTIGVKTVKYHNLGSYKTRELLGLSTVLHFTMTQESHETYSFTPYPKVYGGP